MIDVLEQIKPLLVFETEDDFYYLQILQRKKDNAELLKNTVVVGNYYINSLEYLESNYDVIKNTCNVYNARAMLRLNKRSYKKVAFETLANIATRLSSEQYGTVSLAYSECCGRFHSDKNNKKWIVDFDMTKEEYEKENYPAILCNMRPYGDKIIIKLPTKNGIHLITKPFDLGEFKKYFLDIDVHKDNPINLYVP